MSRPRRLAVLWIVTALAAGAAFLFTGCGDDKGTTRPGLEPLSTCEGCHQDAEMLKASAAPEPPAPPGDPGEG
jgi:hypothetical protein